MSQVFLVGGLDVAELVCYLFFGFFLALVIYLRREDRREGYPLEEDDTGALLPSEGLLQRAPRKTFALPHGGGLVDPEADRPREPLVPENATRAPFAGTPYSPVGDPFLAGIGPGAYARARADTPELDLHGNPKIVPIGKAPGFRIAPGEPNPVGWPVYGADGVEAGTVSDIWVDTTDHLVRYLAVAIPGEVGTNPVLLPITMVQVRRGRGIVEAESLPAAEFPRVPRPAAPDRVTRLEEDRITAFIGAGYLFATPEKAEPWL
ncbi:photosynthetic reaction center subunit H [Thermaurantiacus sp.]